MEIPAYMKFFLIWLLIVIVDLTMIFIPRLFFSQYHLPFWYKITVYSIMPLSYLFLEKNGIAIKTTGEDKRNKYALYTIYLIFITLLTSLAVFALYTYSKSFQRFLNNYAYLFGYLFKLIFLYIIANHIKYIFNQCKKYKS